MINVEKQIPIALIIKGRIAYTNFSSPNNNLAQLDLKTRPIKSPITLLF